MSVATLGHRVGRTGELGPYAVERSCIRLPDASVCGVLATAAVDIESMDAERRTRTIQAFARLARTLDTATQLLIRVRSMSPAQAGVCDGARSVEREAAMRRHWERRLMHAPAHTRRIYATVRARSEASLDEHLEHVRDMLRACGLSPIRLSDAELVDVLTDGFRVDLAVPWKEHPDHLEIGRLLISGYALRRLPGHPVSPGWLAPLVRVDAECDIAIHMAPAALGDALSSIGRRLRDHSAHRLLEAERGVVGDAHVEVAIDSAFTLRDRLARNLGRPVHVSVTACVRAEDGDELRRSAAALRVAFGATLARAEPAHFRHAHAFTSTLPICVDALAATKLVESASAATCFPWLDAGGADPSGYRLGSTQRSGVPVRLDPFDTNRHVNANVAVLAASGQGKSFAIGALILEAAERGIDSIVIDPEGEYEAVCRAAGGASIDLAPGRGTSINVFDASREDDDEAATAVVELAAALCGDDLSTLERAHVDAAARSACARAARESRVPVIADCVSELDDAPRVAAVLRRFSSGALGQLFSTPTSIQFDRGTLAISLRDLPDEFVPAATLIVARCLWRLVRRQRAARHIVFDEVGALAAHPPLRSLLVQLARRCRKNAASLVVATQNAQDLLASDEGRVVVTNCATVLLGGHCAAEAALMEAAFGFTAAQRHFLESAGRGEFLLLAGERRLEMRVDVPDLHRRILEAGRTG